MAKKKREKTPEQWAAEYRQRKSKQYQQEHKERAARAREHKRTHVPHQYPSIYRPTLMADPDFITNDDIAAALEG